MLNFDEDAKRIGRNITNLLIEHDKSQQDLANALNVSKSTVSTWTNGKRIPRMDKVNMMCSFFGVERSAILGESRKSITNRIILDDKTKDMMTDIVRELMEKEGVLTHGQSAEYYDSETVQMVTDRLRNNPEYSVLFKAASNLKPEDVEFVTKFIEKMSE